MPPLAMQDTAFYKLLTDNTLRLSPFGVGTPTCVSTLFTILKSVKNTPQKTKFKYSATQDEWQIIYKKPNAKSKKNKIILSINIKI